MILFIFSHCMESTGYPLDDDVDANVEVDMPLLYDSFLDGRKGCCRYCGGANFKYSGMVLSLLGSDSWLTRGKSIKANGLYGKKANGEEDCSLLTGIAVKESPVDPANENMRDLYDCYFNDIPQHHRLYLRFNRRIVDKKGGITVKDKYAIYERVDKVVFEGVNADTLPKGLVWLDVSDLGKGICNVINEANSEVEVYGGYDGSNEVICHTTAARFYNNVLGMGYPAKIDTYSNVMSSFDRLKRFCKACKKK